MKKGKSKSYDEIFEALQQEYTLEEIAESFVFPGPQGPEREAMLAEFTAFRKHARATETPEEKLIVRMLELRFQVQHYLKTDAVDEHLHFAHFLKEYITRLAKTNKDFAADIDIDPAELSLVLNRRRQPTDKLIYRLQIHSNENFPAVLWFKLLEKERAYELSRNKELIDKERKHVKKGLTFSFKKLSK
ncbi:hypothetical protein F0L74_07660 [Chitinophaga agrisoli]|uniref:Uncharacterized protein n=1 Tax=Chitinophaga agrisoli TaxID=2607653 RepID=A0A5B2VUE2_9BACT|nr:hypothetical protein [Chitinophaga agrisoli]KAA2242414.1 hypothetical protein F0L74_07660 [Chitinophaga agrisoli]